MYVNLHNQDFERTHAFVYISKWKYHQHEANARKRSFFCLRKFFYIDKIGRKCHSMLSRNKIKISKVNLCYRA